MIKIIISIFIFCIILFLYLHIHFHLKTSDNLEIYEVEQASKERFEEICDLRQPVLLELEEEQYKIIDQTNINYLVSSFPTFDINIRETKIDMNPEEELYIPLHIEIGNKLFQQDRNQKYYSENNQEFLQETGIIKIMQQNDFQLRPPLVSNCNYDIMMGSNGSFTPFRYDINYRNYYIVTQGSIQVKLAPPKSNKYLYHENDYENFEFRSQINPWNPQDKYINEFNKIKCLEITLIPGKCLYIPAYWYYSFKFENNASVSCFQYRTYLNNIAILPHIAMYTLQSTNVERKIAKKIDIKNLLINNNKKTNEEIIQEIYLNTKTNIDLIIETNTDLNTNSQSNTDLNKENDIINI
jgi:hypothetical protein